MVKRESVLWAQTKPRDLAVKTASSFPCRLALVHSLLDLVNVPHESIQMLLTNKSKAVARIVEMITPDS